MENFGKFIDDIRKEIKNINIFFEYNDNEDICIITNNDKSVKYIYNTKISGEIPYDNIQMYKELLSFTIDELKKTNEKENKKHVIYVLFLKLSSLGLGDRLTPAAIFGRKDLAVNYLDLMGPGSEAFEMKEIESNIFKEIYDNN